MNAVAKVETQGAEVATVHDMAGSVLEIISRAARDPSVDIDKLERLLQMQERIQDREAKTAFNVALAAMQPKLPIITERGRIIVKEKLANGKRDGDIIQDTSFARWEDINEEIRPLLSEHGFALTFRNGLSPDGKVRVTTVLKHTAGHEEETHFDLPHDSSGSKNAVQAIGSSTSYAKRYGVLSILNITTKGEDDNGVGTAPLMVEQEKASDAPFPQGPCKNKTELKAQGRDLWRDVAACGDADELAALLATNTALMAQLKDALPQWWDGGDNKDGTKFEGLGEVITRRQNEYLNYQSPFSGG
jgi:hypothetical protein